MQGHTLGGHGGSHPMTPEELRRSRLAALDPGVARKEPETMHDEDADNLQKALALSLQATPRQEPPAVVASEQEDSKPAAKDPPLTLLKEPYDVTAFHAIMWDAHTTTNNDKMRWVGQGIHVVTKDNNAAGPAESSSSSVPLTVLEQLAQAHTPWGLQQQHGGPCGVLAVVQAEILRLLLWGPRNSEGGLDFATTSQQLQPSLPRVSDLVRPALARSIALILARVSLTPTTSDDSNKTPRKPVVRIVLPKEYHPSGALQWEDMEPWSSMVGGPVVSDRLETFTLEEEMATVAKRQKRQNESISDMIHKLAQQVTDFLVQPCSTVSDQVPLDYFCNAGGVLLLVMSMVASRGSKTIQEEFDDPTGTRLTAQFGHCSQELMNLMLTGQAVSNVFDNTMNLGESMVCRGITHRPDIGYLTQLEALRYCQVGDYYKSPRFPVWVVGSTSHFTVLFSDSSSLQETESDKLLERCRRAFKEIEADDNGFIPVDQLGKVLEKLNIDLGDNVSTLGAHLEVSGAGIILWDDFWKAASRLLTGATLETIVGDGDDDKPPPLIRAGTPPPPTAIAPAQETDEEMARRLATEWGTHDGQLQGIDFLGEAAARAASPINIDTDRRLLGANAMKPPEGLSADEALAWKLQAEWDAEANNGSVTTGSHEAVSGSPARSDELALPATPPRKTFQEPADQDAKPSGDRTVRFAETPKFEFEQYGDSFPLYHYNGLRGGTLTSFRVTRLSPEEAVGASIALNRAHASDGSGDLEDVVRTKWPSCVIDWGGKKPPYID